MRSYSYIKGFNPRICKRCDTATSHDRLFFIVSIHASVKDATNQTEMREAVREVSIHASVKDAT